MPYTQLLNRLIDESGLTAKEIAERCKQQGQEITASYVSILRKEANERIPSDEVSHILEEVLGAPKDTLVLEAYLDNAPEAMKEFLDKMKVQAFELAIRALDSAIPIGEAEREEIAAQLEQMPLAQVLLRLSQQEQPVFDQNFITRSEQTDDGQINVSMGMNMDFPITDSSMQPVLPEGSKAKLKLQVEYRSGDIVAIMSKGNKNMLFRKLYETKDDKRMLVPLNHAFDVIEYDPSSMLIFGRVEAVVTAL